MVRKVRSVMTAALTVMLAALFFMAAGTTGAEAARPCKSDADAKATAEEFCGNKLKCDDKTPPEELLCRGKPGRWICRCVKAKAGGSESDRSEPEERADASPSLYYKTAGAGQLRQTNSGAELLLALLAQ